MSMLQGLQFPLQGIIEQITYYLNTGWGLVIFIGTFASALLIAMGFIYWCTGINPKKGRKMVIGGVILFIAMQWLAINFPWQGILG